MYNPYFYKAKVIKVYDGDTITLDVDLGFSIRMEMRIRLYGINAPELKGMDRELGILSRDYLMNLIADKEVILETIKDEKGKFGRILGIIHIDGLNVNELLIKEGYAKKYNL